MFSRLSKSLVAFVLLVALLIPFGITPANAAFENTYTNTGNMREDIIGVALTQVGYDEGYNNYTKYGEWYGLPNSPWCGMFVSWCAAQAGIPTSVLRRTGLADPDCFGVSYQSGLYYTPQKGDLFFKTSFSHVGLVYYTEGDYFYTVEGNTSTTSWEGTSVMIRCRKISDYYFSSPNYSGSGSGSSSSSSGGGCSHKYSYYYESAHPHEEYVECDYCGSGYYTGYTSTSSSCTTCIQAACSHSFSDWAQANSSAHTRSCYYCGLSESTEHNWTEGEILSEATCVAAGRQRVTCSVCAAESEIELPATNQHTYDNASYISAAQHQMICTVCNQQELREHTPSGNWKHDALYHWTSCADCGGRLVNTEHNYSNGCLAPCDTCGFTQDNGHKFLEKCAYDSEYHWRTCQICGQTAETQRHVFSSECDETCNECDYHRNTNEAHMDEFRADEAGHWRACKNCKRETPHIAHTADRNCKDWDNVVCFQCQYVLVSSDRHQHTLQTCAYDSTYHWGTCVCGETIEPEIHHWDVQSGLCSDCGAAYIAKNKNRNFFATWLANLFGTK